MPNNQITPQEIIDSYNEYVTMILRAENKMYRKFRCCVYTIIVGLILLLIVPGFIAWKNYRCEITRYDPRINNKNCYELYVTFCTIDRDERICGKPQNIGTMDCESSTKNESLVKFMKDHPSEETIKCYRNTFYNLNLKLEKNSVSYLGFLSIIIVVPAIEAFIKLDRQFELQHFMSPSYPASNL